MEEGSILVVLEAVVEFVLPDDASSAFEVNDFEVERRLDKVTHKGDGTFNTGIAPLRRGWMSSVDTPDGGSDDLVAG